MSCTPLRREQNRMKFLLTFAEGTGLAIEKTGPSMRTDWKWVLNKIGLLVVKSPQASWILYPHENNTGTVVLQEISNCEDNTAKALYRKPFSQFHDCYHCRTHTFLNCLVERGETYDRRSMECCPRRASMLLTLLQWDEPNRRVFRRFRGDWIDFHRSSRTLPRQFPSRSPSSRFRVQGGSRS